jgi:hypothetical protein
MKGKHDPWIELYASIPLPEPKTMGLFRFGVFWHTLTAHRFTVLEDSLFRHISLSAAVL